MIVTRENPMLDSVSMRYINAHDDVVRSLLTLHMQLPDDELASTMHSLMMNAMGAAYEFGVTVGHGDFYEDRAELIVGAVPPSLLKHIQGEIDFE